TPSHRTWATDTSPGPARVSPPPWEHTPAGQRAETHPARPGTPTRHQEPTGRPTPTGRQDPTPEHDNTPQQATRGLITSPEGEAGHESEGRIRALDTCRSAI